MFFKKLKARLARPCFAEWQPNPTQGKIEFKKKPGLALHSLHSANESWEGMNILAWVMDEASAFRTVNGGDNAAQVYGTLRTSAQSRFGWMHWVGIIISFPRKQEGDFTLTKYQQSLLSDKMYGDRACTWEVHPRWQKDHPMYQPASDQWVVIDDLNVRVPKEFEDDFKHDGVDAMTKYMAQPPLTEGGFFENPETITESVNLNLPPLITKIGEREEVLENGKRRRYIKHELEQLHGDPALNSDSFALALCHTTPEEKQVVDQTGQPVTIQKVIVDFVLTWEPKRRKPVDLLNVDETIMFLAKYYNVRRVTFDRWNSAQSIQKLISFGIDAEDMSFTMSQQYAMYRYLRLCFYNAMIELPEDEPLQNELKFLKEKNGHITHDTYGKDRADAVAVVVSNPCFRITRVIRSSAGARQRTLKGSAVSRISPAFRA